MFNSKYLSQNGALGDHSR